MLQKMLIIIFLNFFDTYVYTKGIFIFFLVTSYGIAAELLKPYKKK